MSRGWFVLLALSLGLNAGLLYHTITADDESRIARRYPRFIHHDALPGREGHGPPSETGEFARQRLHRMADRLELVQEQREAMRAILDEMLPRIMEERERVQEARLAIREEYAKSEPDQAEVRSLVRRLNESQARLDSLVAETMLREGELLTPEQRARYFEALPWERPMGEPREDAERRRGRGRR